MRALALPFSLLMLAAPLRAEPIPQPVVLDWTGEFRLNGPPKNLPESAKVVATPDESATRRLSDTAARSPSVAAMGPSDPTKTRLSNRPIAPDMTTLNVETPLQAGPVSVGASYGKYRAMPTTREVSAHDMRVSLGVAF